MRVYNERGALTVKAKLSERVRPGLVTLPFAWWGSFYPERRSANLLTNDALSDWGGGASFHDTLVEVRRLADG